MPGDGGRRHPLPISAVTPQWVADEAARGFPDGPWVPREATLQFGGQAVGRERGRMKNGAAMRPKTSLRRPHGELCSVDGLSGLPTLGEDVPAFIPSYPSVTGCGSPSKGKPWDREALYCCRLSATGLPARGQQVLP